MSGRSGSSVDRFAHVGTAAVVFLLHALMIGLFARALQPGALVIPLLDAHSPVPLKPEETQKCISTSPCRGRCRR
jgi:hypothetical protein